jgi:hypothetical protein
MAKLNAPSPREKRRLDVIILQGDVRNGFRFIGPFPDYGKAELFSRRVLDPDVTIAWLENPDEYRSAGTLAEIAKHK